ncbi:hypothetical protein ACWKSP_07615 [Micromonosporaceae bacterium Da 78-11]
MRVHHPVGVRCLQRTPHGGADVRLDQPQQVTVATFERRTGAAQGDGVPVPVVEREHQRQLVVEAEVPVRLLVDRVRPPLPLGHQVGDADDAGPGVTDEVPDERRLMHDGRVRREHLGVRVVVRPRHPALLQFATQRHLVVDRHLGIGAGGQGGKQVRLHVAHGPALGGDGGDIEGEQHTGPWAHRPSSRFLRQRTGATPTVPAPARPLRRTTHSPGRERNRDWADKIQTGGEVPMTDNMTRRPRPRRGVATVIIAGLALGALACGAGGGGEPPATTGPIGLTPDQPKKPTRTATDQQTTGLVISQNGLPGLELNRQVLDVSSSDLEAAFDDQDSVFARDLPSRDGGQLVWVTDLESPGEEPTASSLHYAFDTDARGAVTRIRAGFWPHVADVDYCSDHATRSAATGWPLD